MRLIKTQNNYVEFIEADDSQNILSVRGFQFGELYFQIKNGKVTFYLNDQENPWRNDVWTINIPFELDGELYEDEDSAAAALEAIINDKFQEQLDKLKEDLADEVTRSTAKDAEHDAEISGLTDGLNNEIARAMSAETEIANDLDQEIADRIADVDAEEARALAAEEDLDDKIDSLNDKVDNEITRSTAKDAEHDALISGLTEDLEDEIARTMSAETVLHDEILAEEARALAAESALTDALNDEITRSTAKDASHDAEISGLTTSLQNEINRAVGAENSLRDDLNDEVSARTSADSAMVQRITALEVGKADKSDVYTKAESDNKYVTKEYVSGNTYTKAEIATMMADKADKLNAVSTALYNSQNKTIDLKNIYGNVVASIDARDFIKDGMVDTVSVSGTNLVITFNTDAGKEDIVVPLPDIFDPSNYYTKAETDEAIASAIDDIDLSNYYTKTEVDASQLAQDNKINAISGDVQTLSGKVDTISANTYTKSEVDDIVNDIESGITQDLSNYYTKSEVDASQTAQDNKINAISGKVETISGDVQTISGKVDDIKAYKAGRGISITSGATADTISFNLPISAGTGSNSIIQGYKTKAETFSLYSHAEGYSSTTVGSYSHAEGYSSTTVGDYSHAEGITTKATGDYSHAEGSQTEAGSTGSHAEGLFTNAATPYSFVCGLNGVTSGDSNIVQDTNTIFAIGNGLDDTHKTTIAHNAFEVKLNGDIYISNTNASGKYYAKPMIKLQDALGQGGGGVTSGQVQTMIDNSISGKADTSDVYNKTEVDNKVSVKPNVWCGSESEWSAISGSTESGTIYLVY